MKPFISPATRTKCLSCGGARFEKKPNREFDNEIPSCVSCGGRPKTFRVIVSIPIIGGKGFKKIPKTVDEKGKRLDSPSRADAYCEYVKDKMALDGKDFDPREIGNKAEQDRFLFKNIREKYLKDHGDRIEAGTIAPGGYAKKEKVMRLYIAPMFGEYSVRDLSYQIINRELLKPFIEYEKIEGEKTADEKIIKVKTKLTNSIKIDMITELGVIFKWCCKEGLLKTPPQLPTKPTPEGFDPDELYSRTERDMVINNIRNLKARIGCILLAVYTRRKCEIEHIQWGKFDFKNERILFNDHVSDGRGVTPTLSIKGLKASPKKVLKYTFFPGLRALLIKLNPSLDPNEYVFKGKRPGKPVHKNFFYEYWQESALDLIKQGKLSKYCDMHRGTRSSTLTFLSEDGHSSDSLGQLYAGDERTMNSFYIKQSIQNTDGLLTSDGLVN